MTNEELAAVINGRLDRIEAGMAEDRRALWGKLDDHSRRFEVHAEKLGQNAVKIEAVHTKVGIWSSIVGVFAAVGGGLLAKLWPGSH